MEEGGTVKNQESASTKKFFSDALLIAALTGVGYLSAFFYQFSYLRYFGIPIFFVDVNLASVLLTSLIALALLLTVIPYFDFLLSSETKNKFYIFKKIFSLFSILTILGLPFLAFFFNLSNSIVLLVILIIFAALIILLAIYGNKYPKPLEENQKRIRHDLLSTAEELFGLFPIKFIAILIFFIVYCGGIGKIVAQTTTNYLVSNTNPEFFIVSNYSENFIGLTFNKERKTFDKNLTLFSQSKISDKDIIFSNQEIGPLKSH